MKDTVTKFLGDKRKNKSGKKRAMAILLTLSIIVAAGTVWSLHQTGESMTKVAYCGSAEHTHTLACYSDPYADLENESIWEQSVASAELTGNAGEDVAAIAKSQLGYTESVNNYEVVTAEDGTESTKGYTRYGAWYGSAYEDWSAMFASFCIYYAGVDYPLEASCPEWMQTLSDLGCYVSKDDGTPDIGDLVFFDQNGDGTSVCVGVVSELTEGGIKVIQGDRNDQVTECGYTFSDETIVGYGLLPKDHNENNGTSRYPDDDTTVAITDGYDNADYVDSFQVSAAGEKDATFRNVVFHDIKADGSERNYSINLHLEDGKTIREALAAYEEDVAWSDGTMLADCVWYTVDEDGVKTLVDDSTVVSSRLGNLYTYSYKAKFKVNSGKSVLEMLQSLMDIDDNEEETKTLIIEARDGETITAADFIVDGVDYTLYNWEDRNKNPINVSDIIENGLTKNVEATTSDTLQSGISSTDAGIIHFYVCIDGNWTLCATEEMTGYQISSGSDSGCYLSAGQLEKVYGKYGFKASDLKAGSRLFPYSSNDETLLADRAAIASDGTVYSPICNSGIGSCSVYYTPAENVTHSASRSSAAADNSFYTITLVDPQIRVMDEKTTVSYVFADDSKEMILNNIEGYEWKASNGQIPEESSTTDTTTFTLTEVTQPMMISLVSEETVSVNYVLNPPEEPSDPYAAPKIGGSESIYVDDPENGSNYTILSPSYTTYNYSAGGKYLGVATFQGWATNAGSQNVEYGPGEVINNISEDLTLYGVWTINYANSSKRTGSAVNFFVSLQAVVEGTTDWTGSTESENFTNSVYAMDCGVAGSTATQGTWMYDGKKITTSGSSQTYILGGTSGTDLNAYHQIVTTELTSGLLTHTVNGKTTVCKGTFPDDETVLRNIRAMVAKGTSITINGHTITVDELTAKNFTVKWHVFKYEGTDGWHIDGILVAKTGKLIVTKTFAGDETAIDKIQQNDWSISVESKEKDDTVNDGKTLYLKDAAYDDITKIYTWVVDVDQYYDYTVKENNYVYNKNQYTTNASYRIRDAKNSDQNTSGYVTYPTDGIEVTGGLGTDVAKPTVSLLNTYTAPGTLILQKMDAATGNLMPDVSFTVSKKGNDDFVLYNTGGSGYTADASGSTGTGTTTVTTDYSGQAYLFIGGGTYTFDEKVPTGYDDPGVITAELNGSDENEYKVISIGDIGAENKNHEYVAKNENDSDNLTLIVKNYSRTVDLTIRKDWLDGENTDVTLQLYRNGVSMGSNYQVSFGTTKGWTKTFEDIPLYANGDLAQYTLVEETIGEHKYSSEFMDGYRYYNVTMSDMVYTDADDHITTVPADIEHITLTVTNKRDTGELKITKTDDANRPLSGAVFYLYSASKGSDGEYLKPDLVLGADGTQSLSTSNYIKSVTSDADGEVNFGSMSAGMYYIVEHDAPDGYTASDKVYLVSFAGGEGTQMTYWDSSLGDGSGAWSDIMSSNTVVNVRHKQYADLIITKIASGTNGAKLAGAEFTLTNDSGEYYSGSVSVNGEAVFETNEEKLISSSDGETLGQIHISGLPEGTYTLIETKAPDGYHGLSEEICIVVNQDGVVTASKTGGESLKVTKEKSEDGNGYTNRFQVENSTGAELPHTGGAGTILFTLGGMILMGFAFVYGCQLRRRRERREE